MNADQMANIPRAALHEAGTRRLRRCLNLRGLRMTLADLEAERRRRPPQTHRSDPDR